MGPLNDEMKQDQPRAAGLDPLRHRVDHAGRVPRVPGAQGRLAQHRLVRRRHHRARPRARLRRPAADPGGARPHARAGAPGDGGRRAGRRLVADLRAGVLRLDRGADRALQGGRRVRRHVHLAHAERGRATARGHRRADPHRARSRAARPRSTTSRPSGKENWGKLDAAIAKVEEARAEGLRITADMYTYIAGSTGLDATMPPWVQEGGLDAWIERMKDPDDRASSSSRR